MKNWCVLVKGGNVGKAAFPQKGKGLGKTGGDMLGIVGVASQGDDASPQLVIPLQDSQHRDGFSQSLAGGAKNSTWCWAPFTPPPPAWTVGMLCVYMAVEQVQLHLYPSHKKAPFEGGGVTD